ncbi:DUF2884 family protein [Pseudoxanthomonas dokdonensis]|uniref:DUF2884 family protein n=1 Tax=Pseudoxanthomonas dokdonensis TaxID=344882 RepID=UPI00070BBC9C|nr:DUF2884 family protein [Pseudoxanthomonas dokdonensis]
MRVALRKLTISGCLLLALAACQPTSTVETAQGSVSSSGLRDHLTINSGNLPPARIGRDGSLRIDGQPIALSPVQQQLVRDYYAQLDGISQAGIEVGKQGAALAGKAASEAVKGILSGNSDAVGEKIEAETSKIETAALQLCDHLAGLRAAQDALGRQVPQFQPYAHIHATDVDDCRDKSTRTGLTDAERARKQTEVRQEIRQGIRQALRGGVRTAAATVKAAADDDSGAGSGAAATADAAADRAAVAETKADNTATAH